MPAATDAGASGADNLAESAARSVWVERLARFGYAAKGAVYVVIGILAIETAVKGGGDAAGSEGALREIAGQPFGQILLAIVGLGLAGYAVWRLIEAVIDPEGHGTEMAALAQRAGYFVSSVSHGFLAFYAARLLLRGAGGGGGAGSAQTMTGKVLGNPFGAWVVGIAGAGLVAYALVAAYRSYRASFMKRLHFTELPAGTRTWVRRVGRLGLAARCVVFSLMGIFLLKAAVGHDPEEARGLEGALETVAAQPYGPWLLGLVAAGLVCYGLYSMVKARYRVFATGS